MFTHIKEFSKFLMLAGFVSMMTACEQVQSEVVSFSSLAPQAPGGAYYVLPSQEQASSVEFLQYSQSIGRRLSKKGWYQVANESEAKFIVLLDYGVAGSTSKTGSITFMDRAAAASIILVLSIHFTVDLEPNQGLHTQCQHWE